MLSTYVAQVATEDPNRPFVITNEQTISFGDAARQVQSVVADIEHTTLPKRVLLHLPNSLELLLLVIGLDHLGRTVILVRDDYPLERVKEIAQQMQAGAFITRAIDEAPNINTIMPTALLSANGNDRLSMAGGKGGHVILLTTGSTGKPKGVSHRWQRLIQSVRVSPDLGGQRWLLSYNLTHFAGMQLFLHALCNGGTVVIPASPRPEDALDALRKHRVAYASGTPTFWRLLTSRLAPAEAKGMALRQITLGGEAATEDVLERLTALFPDANISQVFATTETGPAFSVTDRHSGFPAAWLNQAHNGVELRIVEGELEIRSAYAMDGYVDLPDPRKDGWHRTGDLVTVKGDRVHFLGRRTDMINVGGVKVLPMEVEETILDVDGVMSARVYGRPNPVTGQIVVADVVLETGRDETAVTNTIREVCRETLNRYAQPRLIQVVETLPTANQKVIRNG